MKSMTQASAFFEQLAPKDRTFTQAALDVALEQAKAPTTEAMVKEMARKQAVKLAGQAAHAAPDYLKSLLSWNNQFKKGRITVALDTSSLDSQVRQIRSITSIVVVAILICGGMIGSAIAATSLQGEENATMRQWSYITFFGCLGLGLFLVIVQMARWLRDDRSSRRGAYPYRG
jgi:hypothetical protein